MTILSHGPSGAPPAGCSGPRRALIVPGGGMRVAYQAGVRSEPYWNRAYEAVHVGRHYQPCHALLRSLTGSNVPNRWHTLKVNDFVSFMPFRKYLRTTHLMGMGDADGIIQKVFPHLGIDVTHINAARGMEGTLQRL